MKFIDPIYDCFKNFKFSFRSIINILLKSAHTYRNRTTIFKPFNFQIRVRHWFQFALEVGVFPLAEILLTFRSRDESRFNGDNLVDHLLPLVSGSILQVLYSLQTLGMLGLQEQIFLRVYSH